MKYNLSEELHRRTKLGWFIISVLTTAEEKEGRELIERYNARTGDSYANVTLTIEGVEVDLRQHIDRMDEQFDRCVSEAAVERVKTVLGDSFSNRIVSLQNAFDEYEWKLREMFGLPPRED